MTTTICDFCGKELAFGESHNPRPRSIKFCLAKRPTGSTAIGVFEFEAMLDITAQFNSTNIHWCKECIMDGLSKGKVIE